MSDKIYSENVYQHIEAMRLVNLIQRLEALECWKLAEIFRKELEDFLNG